jgi:hypothetical protein
MITNGDRLTGEVKKLKRGKLSFKTHATDTIQIDWNDVASISAGETFEVETLGGDRIFGSLAAAGEGQLEVVGEEGSQVLELLSVVALTQIEELFWQRFDGYLDLGFNITSSDNRRQYSLGALASYRAPKSQRSLSFNAVEARQSGVDKTSRESLNLEIVRPLRHRKRLLVTLTSLERNDELGLDLRALFGAAAGWYVVQSNSQLLNLFTGLAATSEKHRGDEPSQESIEGILGLSYQSFKFDTPERDIDVVLALFPSFSQSGRWRGELRAKVSWEIVKDFYIALTVLGSHDSDPPPTSEAEETDYSLSTSFGWSF